MARLALALLALALASHACSGTRVGDYKVGPSERTLGTQVDDATLTSRVKTKLLADGQVSGLDINVDTYQGVVTLHGHVETGRQADRAVGIARGVSGVRGVRSKLVVLSD